MESLEADDTFTLMPLKLIKRLRHFYDLLSHWTAEPSLVLVMLIPSLIGYHFELFETFLIIGQGV
jgi:hypothetical protein